LRKEGKTEFAGGSWGDLSARARSNVQVPRRNKTGGEEGKGAEKRGEEGGQGGPFEQLRAPVEVGAIR